RRPVPPDPDRLNPGWLAAQRRGGKLISRPATPAPPRGAAAARGGGPAGRAAAGGARLASVVVLLGWTGWLNPVLTGLGVVTFGGLAAAGAVSAWRGRQGLKA